VVHIDKNIGGAGGFSLGMKEAVLAGADYVWLMDDDTIPNATALEELLKVSEREGVGFSCSRVMWTNGKDHPRNTPGGKYIDKFKKNMPYLKSATPCEICSFVSVLISSRAVYEVGLPFKEFFIWCDDVEYTGRISKAGFHNFYCPQSIVVHKTKEVGSYSVADAPFSFASRFYYQVRNSTYLKHRDTPNWLLFRLSIWNKWRRFRRRIRQRKDGHEQDFLDVVRKGLRDGVTFWPEIEYVQHSPKENDGE